MTQVGMNYKRQCLMGRRSERNTRGSAWDELQEAVLDGTE